MIIRLIALLFAIVSFAGAAEAQTYWSTPASACVPDEATIRFNRHDTGNAFVRHAQGNLDMVVLTCPIQRFDPGATTAFSLTMIYRDSTGDSPSAYVRAKLYRMAANDDAPVLIATANSNNNSITTVNIGFVDFAHTFNFSANIYWARIELDRSLASEAVIIHSLRIVDDSV
jgi:hypothetical protein